MKSYLKKKFSYLYCFLGFGFKVYESHKTVFFAQFVLNNSCLLFKNPLKGNISVPDSGTQTQHYLANYSSLGFTIFV